MPQTRCAQRVARFARVGLHTAVVALLAASPAAAERGTTVLDLGAGTSIPFSGNLREDYGSAFGVSLGFARRLTPYGALVGVEVELWSNSGRDFTPDPTFEVPASTYTLGAIDLGFRRSVIDADRRRGFDVLFGMGAQWVFARWEGSFGDAVTTPTLGAYLEFRPEIDLGAAWALWARGRVTVQLDTNYPSPGPEQNYSGPALQLGVSRYLGGSPS